MDKELYCDYSATTPVLPEVLVEMMPYLMNGYGNPSSVYTKGREAKEAIENARKSIANNMSCKPEEIIFTSGGTESDNLAIKGIAQLKGKNGLYITSKIEHPAVLNVFKELEEQGYEVIYLDVDSTGLVFIEQLIDVTRSQKKINLVSIMYANNELGIIQPIEEIGHILKAYDEETIFHCDAVQAVGKKMLHLNGCDVDLLSASGHKFGAPKGIGFLYKKKGLELNCQNIGGGQENNLRSGTENVASIVGMAKALEIHMDNLINKQNQTHSIEGFIRTYLKNINGTHFNSLFSDKQNIAKIHGILNVRFDNISAQSLLLYLDNKGIYVSAGSACHSDSDTPSHVLKAIGLTDEEALSSIRISFDNSMTANEVYYLVENIKESVEYLRKM